MCVCVQFTLDISLTGTNDHSPIFEQPQYLAMLTELSDITGTMAAVNTTVSTVHATDGDGLDSPSGLIEYVILTGNTLNGEVVFDILIPSVSVVAA